MDIMNYGVSEKYKEYARYGDSLHEMGEKTDWESLGIYSWIFMSMIR